MVDQRSPMHRIYGRRPRLTLWWVLALLVVLTGTPAWTQTAALKDIRIGEYETFLRVVFEFEQVVRHDEPVDKGDGKLAITFRDSAAKLQTSTLQYVNRRIEAISLVQQGNDLTAHIALPVSQFRLKTFTLTAPDRVVLDIYQAAPAAAPPAQTARIIIRDLQIKESLTPPPPIPQTDASDDTAKADSVPEASVDPPQAQETTVAPAAAPTSTLPAEQADDEVLPSESQPQADDEVLPSESQPQAPDASGEETATPAPQTPAAIQPGTVAQTTPPAPAVESAETPQTLPQTTPTIVPKTATAVSTTAPSVQPVAPQSGSGQLQHYLTIALIIIGTIIVLFVCFIFIQKRRTAHVVKTDKGVEILKNTDEIIAAIDAKIKEKLKAYE